MDGTMLIFATSTLPEHNKWICFSKLNLQYFILVSFSADALTLGTWSDSNSCYFAPDICWTPTKISLPKNL